MLWGAGFGLGLTALLYGIRPPAIGLAEAEQILASETPAETSAPAASARPGLEQWLTAPAIRALSAFGLPGDRLMTDLALTGQDPDTFLTKKVTAAVAGLLMPALFQLMLTAGGVGLPNAVVVCMGLVLGAALFLVPDFDTRARARTARAESRAALGALLSFASTSLQSGDGIEEALASAAAIGSGPSFARFRAAATKSRLSRRSIWDCYGELGNEIDLPELSELGASIRLAGAEGARIADSLTAKSTALRGRLQAESEGQTASATEMMHIPVGLILFAFLLILGFPSVYRIMTTFQ
ncbi:type II secretion system F family protein [Catenulispora sp. NL8]|uniref:Type II secretion system F family protein n=1 Tax=Catenulispora pinistramenti TaxID=2705254 RepID=A0ABS5KN58_9ACTN|nr:type II secretion system F family protein [Catenulispora pinistramenti]MBS2547451.1 type II secretion system F family protein [Catenulispora pinistramenti]